MNRKQKIIVSIVGITIIILALVGITYAYFLTRINGNTNTKSIEVTTADFKLVYDDGTEGILFKENIIPGTVIGSKTFTVTNEGQTKIDDYGVYLESIINDFKYTSDVIYTLECSSSVSGNNCSGKTETSFPTTNEMIVSNEIEPDEVHTYTISVSYKETGSDQSDDMNKHLEGKIQIYDLNNIVDVNGKVTNAQSGDYIEMHSETAKTSQIDSNGNYKIIGVESGSHTLFVKSSDGTTKGTTDFTIQNNETAGVSGSTINITNDIQNVKIDVTNISDTLTISTPVVSKYNPYSDNTNSLAYNIINNTQLGTTGTIYSKTPLTKPAEEASKTWGTGNYTLESVSTRSLCSSFYSWSVGETEISAQTGSSVSSFEEAVGKYVNDACTGWTKYLESYDSDTSTLNFRKEILDTEKSLSQTIDDYGISYYFRGNVSDNYINFNDMCWRIVRIEGDGSVKIILADKNSICSNTTQINNPNFSIGLGNFGYSYNLITNTLGQTSTQKKFVGDYLNGTTDFASSMKTMFSNWLESSELNQSILKNDEWCLENTNKLYDSNTGLLLNESKNDLVYNDKSFYYNVGKRLLGIGELKNATLKCQGTTFTSKIATLTADEIAFAGAKVGANNLNYLTSFPDDFWSSLSLASHSSNSDSTFHIDSNGFFTDNSDNVSGLTSLRPSISLISGIEITSGTGTLSSPYEININ